MKYALFGINNGPCSDPDTMQAVAVEAEKSGFESVWTAEHVVLPDPQVPPSPAAPLTPMLHPSTALSFIAAATTTLKLATGITLISQRNPVVLAKEMGSLDYISKGRLILGIGAGYLKSEFDALGVNFHQRGARADEYIDAMRELWGSDNPSFSGEYVTFSGIQSRPRPAQKGGPEIVVGGNSPAAFRRAVTRGSGWYGFAMDHNAAEQALAGLKEAAERYQRPSELGELEISITPRKKITKEGVEQWQEMGVSRLTLLQLGQDKQAMLDDITAIADEFIN